MRKICYGAAGLLLSGVSVMAQERVDSTSVYELNEVVVSAVQARKETPVAFADQIGRASCRERV